jgi:lysophospholipase
MGLLASLLLFISISAIAHVELDAPVQLKNFFTNDGTRLSYTIFGDEIRGSGSQPLVILEGKSETIYRYVEFAQEMLAKGYGPIYVFDHRSQGYSSPGLAHTPDVIHVETFDNYVHDFIQFMDVAVKRDLTKKLILRKPFLVAHSMGGAVANLALRQRPDITDRVAYISPMFDLHLGRVLGAFHNKPVEILADLACYAGCDHVAVGNATKAHKPLPRIEQVQEKEKEFGIRKTKSTWRWIDEALRVTEILRAEGPKPLTRSVIIEATYDEVINNSELYKYACTAKNCSLVNMIGHHALHQEEDAIRYALENVMDEFFSSGRIRLPSRECRAHYQVLIQ